MKEKLTNNLNLKVLAFLLACAVWLIVNNVDDPVRTKKFHNIEVQLQNEEAISSIDKVYEVKTGGVINVKASAKQSVLRRISAKDIHAVADLSNLTLTNAVAIKLSCPGFEKVELSSDVDMLTITLEDEETETKKVDVTTVGTLPEGYALGDIKVRPNLIKVSGAKSQIQRVSEVRVEVDVTDATEGFVKQLEPKAYDANGKLMDAASLSFSSEKVRVSVEVNETYNLPIQVKTTGEPANGYHVIAVEYDPKEVLVTGSAEALASCKSLTMTCSVAGAAGDLETELTLSEYLPENIRVVNTVESINVKVTISQQKLQTIYLPVNYIDVRNVGKDLQFNYAKEDAVLKVQAIWLDAHETKDIGVSDLSAYIDCDGLEVGSRQVPVKFDGLDRMVIESEPKVQIVLKNLVREPEPEEKPDNKDNDDQTVQTEPPKSPSPSPSPTEEAKEATEEPKNPEEEKTTVEEREE